MHKAFGGGLWLAALPLWARKGRCSVDIGNQIKTRREAMGLSQEELAQKIYVSRNTISNWENSRTYPDLQSLLLLGVLFDTSLDTLVKGDLDVMEEKLAESRKRFNRWAWVMAVGLCAVVILIVPLVWMFGWAGIGIAALIWAVAFVASLRVERMKKDADLITYDEIAAFMEGREVERDQRARSPRGRSARMLRTAIAAIAIAAISGAAAYALASFLNLPHF